MRSSLALEIVDGLKAMKSARIFAVAIATLTIDATILTPGYYFTVLKSLSPWAGINRQGSLVLSGSTHYGMAYADGSANLGTIFKINTDGTSFTVLHSFAGGGGAIGAWLVIALIGLSASQGIALARTRT